MYTVVVEFPDEVKTYEFSSLDDAKEVYNHANTNGVKATILDEYGDIIVIK